MKADTSSSWKIVGSLGFFYGRTNRMADRAEDKICIFGFSRGAYTARALAGMVHKARLFVYSAVDHESNALS